MNDKKTDQYDGQGNVLLSEKYRNRPKRKNSLEKIQKNLKSQGIENAAATDTVLESGSQNLNLNRFQARQGQGYAAEQANDLLDRMHGRDAEILGNDNRLNGPDRRVNGQLIQTKYCQTANASVNAAFDRQNGIYRYVDRQGRPMQLEVPSDQYEQAVEIMRKRIAEGRVPGTTNPDDAQKIVRKGQIDYKTACNIAKAGNIDSLRFDAARGLVIGMSALGISGAIVFARAVWDGADIQQAADEAIVSGLKAGGVGFASYVLSAQLTRTGLNQLMLSPSIQAVKLLPSGARKALLAGLRDGAPIYGNAANQNLAKLLRSNIIAAAATVVVMSSGDIINCFRGRISGAQLFKNMTILAGSVASGFGGAAAGAALGTVIGGPIGTAIGSQIGLVVSGIIGGTVGGSVTKAAMDTLIEDDAVQMVHILEERIVPLVQQYLLSEEELSIVLDDLQRELIQDKLMDMYASADREAFADDLLTMLIRRVVGFRVRLKVPGRRAAIQSLGRILERSASGQGILRPRKKADPQAVARAVLGREVSKPAAKKAWYAAKHTNIVTTQQEGDLLEIKEAEQEHARIMQQLQGKREESEEQMKKWMEEDQE